VNIEKVQREKGLAAPTGNRLHRGLFIRRRLMASICRHGADWQSALCRVKSAPVGAAVTWISGMADPALLRPNPAYSGLFRPMTKKYE
jgi:hypothetical protein